MAKKKIINNETIFQSTTETNFPTKIVTEDYDMITFKRKPVSEAYLKIFAAEMVDWFMNNRDEDNLLPLKHSLFLRKKGIHKGTYYRWLEVCDILKKAHEFALMVIGDEREVGGLKRKLDPGMVIKTMAHYDEDWRKLEEWRSKMGEGKSVGNITVRMEQFVDEEGKEDAQEDIRLDDEGRTGSAT